MIGVLNYGAGNIGSVMNALARLNAPVRFVRGPEELSGSASPFAKLLFPGDGHFGAAMESLETAGYATALRDWLRADKPFLGICIGLQVLFDSSEEALTADGGSVPGLGVIPGTVKRFPGRKVPLIGWNRTTALPDSRLFRGLPPDSFFYYIHSYYADPADPSAASAHAEYYLSYCSAVERGAVAAVQFHPEKSGAVGLRLLRNWAERDSP